MGILWSLMNPILMAMVFFLAFKIVMRFEMEDYTLFLLSALFPWHWFSTSLIMSTGVLINNITLIKKVLFPRHFLILSAVISQLVNLLFALPIILVFVYYYGKTPSLIWLIGIPILIIIQFMITVGIALLISILNAFFRDMEYIIGVVLNLLFWLTPIIYPLDAVPGEYRIILFINPITHLMIAWRELFLHNSIMWQNIMLSLISGISFLFVGLWVFNSLNKKLNEVI